MNRICKHCGKSKDITLFKKYDSKRYEYTCKDCFNKSRQENRRISQLKRYGDKMSFFGKIKDKAILAYAAGIIDGEGCIIIGKGKPKGLRLTYQYSLRVTVGMSVPIAIDWLKNNFGGSIKYRANGKYKPIYHWSVLSIQAEGFIKIILPYLKVKRKEAELALEFRNHMNNYIRRNGRIIDDKEVKIREAYKLKLEELKRG